MLLATRRARLVNLMTKHNRRDSHEPASSRAGNSRRWDGLESRIFV